MLLKERPLWLQGRGSPAAPQLDHWKPVLDTMILDPRVRGESENNWKSVIVSSSILCWARCYGLSFRYALSVRRTALGETVRNLILQTKGTWLMEHSYKWPRRDPKSGPNNGRQHKCLTVGVGEWGWHLNTVCWSLLGNRKWLFKNMGYCCIYWYSVIESN